MATEQLTSLTLVLRPKEPWDESIRAHSLGPYLQGVMMEHVDSGYAEFLHQSPFNPYSQYCFWDGKSLAWRVNALTSEAAEHIVDPLQHVEEFYVRGVQTRFEVAKTSKETIPLKTLTDTLREPGEAKVRCKFMTPTAFKSQGTYVILPSVRLLVQNLLMHYGQVYDNNKEGYDETIEFVDKNVLISAYNLRSSYFHHVGGGDKRIPGFTGTLTLSLRGPEMTTGLVRMLLKFGEYAGVGIKTSMGMGGFRCL